MPYFIILELDDSSGRTIEVKLRVSKPPSKPRNGHNRSLQDSMQTEANDDSAPTVESEVDDDVPQLFRKKSSSLKQFDAGTSVENMRVVNVCDLKDCRERHVLLNGKILEPHTVIKAKGTIASYKGIKQLELERAFVVRTTDEEMRVWEEYASCCINLLSKPWHLERSALRRMERADRARVAEATARNQSAEKDARQSQRAEEYKREKRKAREAQEEKLRQREKAELDGNPLDRSRWKSW